MGVADVAHGASAIVLTSPGRSVVAEAIDLAREIFPRVTSSVIYRIASALQLLVFFILAALRVNLQEVMGSEDLRTSDPITMTM